MKAVLCNSLFRVFGHHICCGRIPEWTTRVGQEWKTYDEAPWNLYNVIWRVQNWIRGGMD
ncbi:hypothetical protein [Humibacter ginsengisoli]